MFKNTDIHKLIEKKKMEKSLENLAKIVKDKELLTKLSKLTISSSSTKQ